MGIEEFFINEKYNAVFNPIPAYDGEWSFHLAPLKANSKDDLLTKFIFDTFTNPLSQIFKNNEIKSIEPVFKSMPDESLYGRVLKYSKEDFYKEILNYLKDPIDILDNTKEAYEKSLNKIYTDNIKKENAILNLTFSNLFKNKSERLKDVLEHEFNSRYFDYVDTMYEKYRQKMTFKEFTQKNYDFAIDMYQGFLALGDFFEENLSMEKLYNCFDSEQFYLLFAKIIYEFNYSLVNNNIVNNSCKYLYFYRKMLDLKLQKDNKYNVVIKYGNLNYSLKDFNSDYQRIISKIPFHKIIILPNIPKSERYKYTNIPLMQKWEELFADEILKNWDFLYQGEKIPKNSQSRNINLRIGILENSGFLGMPMRGKNIFANYYAFIYPNGEVVLEYIASDDQLLPTYVIKIDNFIVMCKQGVKNVKEYVKDIENDSMHRIFHSSINNWQRVLFQEINDRDVNVDKVIAEVERIKRSELINETDL